MQFVLLRRSRSRSSTHFPLLFKAAASSEGRPSSLATAACGSAVAPMWSLCTVQKITLPYQSKKLPCIPTCSSAQQRHFGCFSTRPLARATACGRRTPVHLAASKHSTSGNNGADDDIKAAKKDADTAAPQQDTSADSRSYRQLIADWLSLREADLRGLANEGRLQLRDILADPSIRVFGQDIDFSNFLKVGQTFDLSKFKGSFSRVADLSAWYDRLPGSQSADEPDKERGAVGVQTPEDGGQHPAAAAFQQGGHNALSFGFSAGGLLFSYYIGFVYGLHDLGIITRDTKLAGASAGSLIAACYHSGLPEDVVTEACFTLARDCRENGTRGRLGIVLSKFLVELLPDNIHEKCRGRAFVAVTRVFPRPQGLLISEFESKEDLISALMTSCHIPWWFNKQVWTSFRGEAHYDGGLSNFIPLPPAGKGEHGVRACCFPAKQLSSVVDIEVSPDSFTDWEHSIKEMVAWAFEPAEEKMLLEFIAKGRADAKAWAEQTGVAALVDRSQQPDPDVTGAKQVSNVPKAAGAA